jgi:hypothetical protein
MLWYDCPCCDHEYTCTTFVDALLGFVGCIQILSSPSDGEDELCKGIYYFDRQRRTIAFQGLCHSVECFGSHVMSGKWPCLKVTWSIDPGRILGAESRVGWLFLILKAQYGNFSTMLLVCDFLSGRAFSFLWRIPPNALSLLIWLYPMLKKATKWLIATLCRRISISTSLRVNVLDTTRRALMYSVGSDSSRCLMYTRWLVSLQCLNCPCFCTFLTSMVLFLVFVCFGLLQHFSWLLLVSSDVLGSQGRLWYYSGLILP